MSGEPPPQGQQTESLFSSTSLRAQTWRRRLSRFEFPATTAVQKCGVSAMLYKNSLTVSYFWPFSLFYRQVSVWRGFSVAVPGSVAHSVDQLLYCILTTPHRLLPQLSAHLQSIACFVVFGTVFVFYFLRTFQPSRAGAVQVSAPECILAQGRLLLMTFLATQRSLFSLPAWLIFTSSGQESVSSLFTNNEINRKPWRKDFFT